MLSLSPLTVLPCSPLDLIDAASAAGFDAVGLRLQPALETDIDVMADAALRRAIERRLCATRMPVLDVDVIRIGPRTNVPALAPLLQFAGDLGATNLVFTSLPPAEHAQTDEADIARTIAEVCEAAQRHRVRPVVEFIPFRGIASLRDALRIAARVDHPNFAICLDVLHFCRSGGTAAELMRTDPRWISSIQLCDAPLAAPADLPRESRHDRQYPGEGELPLLSLLRALPPTLPVSVEVPNAAAQATRTPFERAADAAASARRMLADARGSPHPSGGLFTPRR